MEVTWADSADEHGIPHDEVLWAILHPHLMVANFKEARRPGPSPTLFVGPSRFGTLEVLVGVEPGRGVRVFHAMRLREYTRQAAGYEGEGDE